MESYMEGCYPWKASFGGIALYTHGPLGNCLPCVSCLVDVYLTQTILVGAVCCTQLYLFGCGRTKLLDLS